MMIIAVRIMCVVVLFIVFAVVVNCLLRGFLLIRIRALTCATLSSWRTVAPNPVCA